MGEYRCAAQTASRRVAQVGGGLQAVDAFRAGDAGARGARPLAGARGARSGGCARPRPCRRGDAQRAGGFVRGGRGLPRPENQRDFPAFAGAHQRAGGKHCRPARVLQRGGECEQCAHRAVSRRDRGAAAGLRPGGVVQGGLCRAGRCRSEGLVRRVVMLAALMPGNAAAHLC